MKTWAVLALLYVSLLAGALLVVRQPASNGVAIQSPEEPSPGTRRINADVSHRGLLITTTTPDVPEPWLSMLLDLPMARDAGEAAGLITNRITTIVVDESALSLLPVSFLRAQVDAGITLIGLNVGAHRLDDASGFSQSVAATSICQCERGPLAEGRPGIAAEPDVPFYSRLTKSGPEALYNRSGVAQKWFSDRLFTADFEQALRGINADIGGRGAQ